MIERARFVSTLRAPGVVLVAGFALAYAAYWRTSTQSMLGASPGIGLWDLILESAMSPQFTAFIIFPAWLVFIMSRTGQTVRYPALYRFGTNLAALRQVCRSSITIYLAAVSLVFLTWCVASLGLPFRSSPAGDSAAEFFQSVNLSPGVAYLLQVAILGLALVSIQAVFLSLRLAFHSTALEVAVAGIAFIWVMASSAGKIPADSLANAGFYLSVVGVVRAPGMGAAAIGIVFVTASLSTVFVALLDRRLRGQSVRLNPAWATYCVICVIVLWLLIASSDPLDVNIFGALSYAFHGAGGSIAQHLGPILLFLGYVFLFQIRFSAVRAGIMNLQLIRNGSYAKWSRRILVTEVVRAALFVLALAALGGFLYLCSGGRDLSLPAEGLGIWLYNFLLNGWLQLCFYLIVCFGTTSFISWPLTGVATLGALLAFATFVSNPTGWMPFSAAGMGRVPFGWGTVIAGTTSLSTALILSIAAVFTATRLYRPQT